MAIGNHLALAGNVLRGVSTVMRTVDFVSTVVEIVNLFTAGLPALVNQAQALGRVDSGGARAIVYRPH